jgi:hypothetical protein
MSESESTPDQGATESSNAPVSKAKPILRSKDSGDQPRSDQRENRDRPARGGDKESGKAKGKGRDRKDQQEPQARVSPALMRGPKMQQPKPAPEPAPEAEIEEEIVTESTDEAVVSSDEAVEVAAEAE